MESNKPYDIHDDQQMANEPTAAYATATSPQMTSVMIDNRVAKQVMLYAQFLMQNLDTKPVIDIEDNMQQIATLPEDWDGYSAKPASKQAIDNCRQLLCGAYCSHPLAMEVLPTNAGAVMFRYKVGKTLLRGEIGDTMVSFFLRSDGKQTEYHNFEPWNEQTIQYLRTVISKI